MRITVNAPVSVAADYLREVADQLDGGYTSGHWDAVTNWDSYPTED